VSEETEFRQPVYKELDQTEFDQLSTKSVMIICYRGRNEQVPEWVDMAPDHFSDLCEVTADLFAAKKSVLPEMNLMTGEIYYRMHFDIVLLFGLTELKAQMAWMENGIERRGPASIVYNTSFRGPAFGASSLRSNCDVRLAPSARDTSSTRST